jgi:hypothetical protein
MTPEVLLDIPESLYLRSISQFLAIMQRGSPTKVARTYKRRHESGPPPVSRGPIRHREPRRCPVSLSGALWG